MARVGPKEHDRLLMALSRAGGMQKAGGLQRFGSEPTSSSRGWEDADEELVEEEVWGDMADATAAQKQGHYQGSGGGTGGENARPSRKSLLSMELQEFNWGSSGGGVKGTVATGIGFASAATENGHGSGSVVTRRVSISGWRESAAAEVGGMPQSAPTSVPVWIRRSRSCDMMAPVSERKCGVGGGGTRGEESVVAEEEEEEEERWIPPHEMVARGQGMTSSVCEGAGRTLKGMDLRRVRNSVWSRTGFVD